ncbi:sulfite exporter TauE/SafE family protein [Paenisporosarcina quisquiliarum]|uniref:Probable membrane transporter protein n=1 Tax=Paenisporosarcina quisquiliarum TaxID=365346 RepID=A0A9X3RDW6_9BACL|nr:sulfite exporter TauE/SafE family protein [Paenisporosarcina quisquiliarum]MCZ8537569.1 sulfite exporter TauE/SafE family protein [Paenisporosarcina quisquiliarum]
MDYTWLFLIGLIANVLGILAGGGGLISLPAMLLMGIPVHSAIGANKVSNTVSSLSSFIVIYKYKEVTVREALIIVPLCLGGGIAGGLIASFLTESTLTIIAIVLLSFALLTSFMGSSDFEGNRPLVVNKKSGVGLFGIGLYDGVFGPGSGTLMMYILSHLGISYIRAVGLARIAIFSSCFGASITYIATGKIMWAVTIALLIGSVSGAQIGVHLARKLKKEYVKPLLRIVTIALIIQIVVTNL